MDYRETIRAIEDAMHEAQVQERFDEWRKLERQRHETWMKARGLWVEPEPSYEQGQFTTEAPAKPTTRYCGQCKQVKPLAEFYASNGRSHTCIACVKAKVRERDRARRAKARIVHATGQAALLEVGR